MQKKKTCDLKEYYIAYMDLLGYKEYFKENPDTVADFFNEIKKAISQAKESISISKKVEYRLFSDNIVIFTEVKQDKYEKMSGLLTLLIIVAQVQRDFVLDHNLFLRGGITQGQMCVDEEFLFGQGLIDAVLMEETACYPRVLISDKIVKAIENFEYVSKEEVQKAKDLKSKLNNKESLTDNQQRQLKRTIAKLNYDSIVKYVDFSLILVWGNEQAILNYIDDTDDYVCEFQDDLDKLEQYCFSEKQLVATENLKKDLIKHKRRVTAQLKKYAGSASEVPDLKEEAKREKILKKYVWVCKYHNAVCDGYNLKNYKIKGSTQLDDVSLALQYAFKKEQQYYLGVSNNEKKDK